jgi:hypothetical protein
MQDEPLINVDDFRKIELVSELSNATTSTKLKHGKMTYTEGTSSLDSGGDKTQDMHVEIEEFLDDGFILEIPTKFCAEGHSVEIEVFPKNAKGYEEFSFWASGAVKDKEKVSPTREKIKLHFQEFKKTDYDQLKSIFAKRQDEILDFFKAAKGY